MTSTGGRTRATARARFITHEPLESAPRVPATTMGRMGQPVSTARRKAPSWNFCSSPVGERVPSGMIITETPLASRSRHSSSALARLVDSPRCTAMSPAIRIIHPMKGILKMDSLESHFISHGRCEIRKMSAKLSWLATATYGRRGSGMRTPVTRNFQRGFSLVTSTAARRNQRPTT